MSLQLFVPVVVVFLLLLPSLRACGGRLGKKCSRVGSLRHLDRHGSRRSEKHHATREVDESRRANVQTEPSPPLRELQRSHREPLLATLRVHDASRETKSQPRGSRISKQRFGSAASRRHEKDRSRQRVKHHSVRGAEERTLQQIVVRLKTTRLQSPILRLLEDWRLLTEKGSAGRITAHSAKGREEGREAHHVAGPREARPKVRRSERVHCQPHCTAVI